MSDGQNQVFTEKLENCFLVFGFLCILVDTTKFLYTCSCLSFVRCLLRTQRPSDIASNVDMFDRPIFLHEGGHMNVLNIPKLPNPFLSF